MESNIQVYEHLHTYIKFLEIIWRRMVLFTKATVSTRGLRIVPVNSYRNSHSTMKTTIGQEKIW